MVLSYSDKAYEKKLKEVENKIADIQKQIDKNLETQKAIIENTYKEPEIHTDFLSKRFQTQEETKNMTTDRFVEIINFIEKTSNHFGIIGGEPTLNPNFKDFLRITRDWCNKTHGSATLFTNGIELEKYLYDLGTQIHCLINTNAPDKMDSKKWNKLNHCLDEIYDKGLFRNQVSLGVKPLI